MMRINCNTPAGVFVRYDVSMSPTRVCSMIISQLFLPQYFPDQRKHVVISVQDQNIPHSCSDTLIQLADRLSRTPSDLGDNRKSGSANVHQAPHEPIRPQSLQGSNVPSR